MSKYYFCSLIASLLLTSNPLFALETSTPMSPESSLTGEIKAIGKENIVILLSTTPADIKVGQYFSAEDNSNFVVKAIDGNMLIVKQTEGKSPKSGSKIKLTDETLKKIAEEKLKKYEEEEANKKEEDISNNRNILDQDYFLSKNNFRLDLGSEIILKQTASANDTTGTVTIENKTKGTELNLLASFAPVQKLVLKANFNYVPTKKVEGSTSTGTASSSSYKGVGDPTFGIAYRIKERLQDSDYSVTSDVEFTPALMTSQTGPDGRTKPGDGYAKTHLNTKFAWKWNKHEFLIGPSFIYNTSGSADGVSGASGQNYTSSFTAAVGSEYQIEMHSRFRLNALVGFTLPYTEEVQTLSTPSFTLKAEIPVIFALGIGCSIKPFKDESFLANLRFMGLIPSGDADLVINRVGNATPVRGVAKVENWSLKVGVGKVF